MAWVIYEDDPTKTVRIHTDSCRYYVNRKSVRLGDNRWYDNPPLRTLEAARAQSRATDKPNRYECKVCLRTEE